MEKIDLIDDNIEVENLDVNNNPDSQAPAATSTRKRSWIWAHFDKFTTTEIHPTRNKPIIKAICTTCQASLAGNTWNGTSSLITHYNSHIKNLDPSQTTINQDPNTGQIVNFRYNAAIARKEIVNYIQMAQQPLGFSENQNFIRMIQKSFQPAFNGLSRSTIRSDIIKDFRVRKSDMVDFFNKFDGKVSLTSDFWSSNQKLDYVCFTAHYIDSDWILQKRIISFRLAEIPHSGIGVGNEFFNVLRDYGLEKKILTISLDNASYYTKAVSYLGCDLDIPVGSVKDQLLHTRCCAIIVNLIVEEGLDQIAYSVVKIRSFVTYIKSSNRRVKNWKDSCSAKGKKILSLIPEVATTWNSCYHMLQRAYDYKDVISFYIESYDKNYASKFLDEDWINCTIYKDFLKVFDEVTVTVSSVYSPTSNLVLLQLMKIMMVFRKYEDDPDFITKYKAAITVMKDKFLKYWKTLPIVFGIATIFDPRFKSRGLEKMLKFLYGPQEGKKQYDSIVSAAREVFTDYNEQTPTIPVIRTHATSTSRSSSDSVWEILKKQRTDSSADSELELYLQRAEERGDENMNILDWWRRESGASRSLSNMAKDFLSVQASTTASERAFSASGRLISDYRSCLKPDAIEASMCNEDWLRAQHRTQEELVRRRIVEDEAIVKSYEEIQDLTINN